MLSALTSLNAITLQESFPVIENEGYVYSETQLCSVTKIVYRYGIGIYELKPFSEAEKKSDNFMTFELEMEVFTSITLWLFEFMELSLYVF